MKSKFGFIPIVLPVLVMVLIIGLVNIGNTPWVQAHDDDAEHTHNVGANHPRLGGITVNDSSTGAAIPGGALMPAFDAEVSSYEVSATYNVESVHVAATSGTNAEAATGFDFKIKRPRMPVLEVTGGEQRFAIPVGTTMVEIRVGTDGNATSPYTIYMVEITRELPQFGTLQLNNARDALTETAAAIPGADVLMGNLTDATNVLAPLMGNDAALRDTRVDVKVKYHVDAIGLTLGVPGGLGGSNGTSSDDAVTVAFTNVPRANVLDSSDYESPPTPQVYEVLKHRLNVGLNRIDIRVAATTTPADYTQYRILVEREKPQLDSVSYQTDAAPTTPVAVDLGLDTTTGKVEVEYEVGEIEVSAFPGSRVELRFSHMVNGEDIAKDADLALGSYSMPLMQGMNELRVTAYDAENAAAGETEYTLTVERKGTPLGGLSLMSSSTNPVPNAGVNLYWDASNQTSTRMGFGAATTTYYTSVPYDVVEALVTAHSPTDDGLTTGTPDNPVGYMISIRSRGVSTSSTTTADTLDTLTETVPLRKGLNQIMVTASIEGNSTPYTVNVTREDPVTLPSELRVIEYKNNAGAYAFSDVVLDPVYDQESGIRVYEAGVRSNVRSVGIAATHEDVMAEIFVNDTKIARDVALNSIDYKEVLLSGDTSTITVTVQLGGNTGDVNITVVRNEGGTLDFRGNMHPNATITDDSPRGTPIKVKDEVTLANPIVLPPSHSDDGDVTYEVNVRDDQGELVELGDLGLRFDQIRRHIVGRPNLDDGEGYEAEFLVIYTARDPVGNETNPLKFVLIITHDDVDPIPPLGVDPTGPANNTLKSLSVDGDGVSGFDPEDAGPYEASVSQGTPSATVVAEPTHPDAEVSISGVVLSGPDYEHVTRRFSEALTITVSFTGLPDMDYTLTINREDVVAEGLSFGVGVDIMDKTYPVGEEIEDLVLPEAVGGSGGYSYTLVDHTGASDAADLSWDVASRTVSGTPSLFDAYKATHQLSYTVTDSEGDTYTDTFKIIVCDPNEPLSGDCRASSSMVELSSLELSDVTLMPAFASDMTMYTSEVPYETMMTTITAMDTDIDTVEIEIMPADADMDMAGHQVELAAGTSTMITVTAMKEYGGTFSEDYTVDVMRAATPTMTEMLTESRSTDGMSATLTWTPDMMNGAAAAHQWVFTVAKIAGDPVDGLAGLDTATFGYEPMLAGDVSIVTIDGLMADRDYVYGVIALFGGPGNWSWGMWEIINYTP